EHGGASSLVGRRSPDPVSACIRYLDRPDAGKRRRPQWVVLSAAHPASLGCERHRLVTGRQHAGADERRPPRPFLYRPLYAADWRGHASPEYDYRMRTESGLVTRWNQDRVRAYAHRHD